MFNFRFCYMFFLRNVSWLLYFVACSLWTHPYLPSKMLTAWISSISGWCGVFWLVKVIHQKVQAHRLWGGRVFAENIPKQSLVPPGSMLNLRVSEFSWVKPEMLQCASVHVLWRHGSEARRVKRNLTCRTLRTSEIGFGWAETADDFETKTWQLHFVGRCKPCKANLQVTAS